MNTQFKKSSKINKLLESNEDPQLKIQSTTKKRPAPVNFSSEKIQKPPRIPNNMNQFYEQENDAILRNDSAPQSAGLFNSNPDLNDNKYADKRISEQIVDNGNKKPQLTKKKTNQSELSKNENSDSRDGFNFPMNLIKKESKEFLVRLDDEVDGDDRLEGQDRLDTDKTRERLEKESQSSKQTEGNKKNIIAPGLGKFEGPRSIKRMKDPTKESNPQLKNFENSKGDDISNIGSNTARDTVQENVTEKAGEASPREVGREQTYKGMAYLGKDLVIQVDDPNKANTKPIVSSTKSGALSPKYLHNMSFKKTTGIKSFGTASPRSIDAFSVRSPTNQGPTESSREHIRITDGKSVEDFEAKLLIPQTLKQFYHDLLLELEALRFGDSNEEEIAQLIGNGDAKMKQAFDVVDNRFGRRYANGLYLVFKHYIPETGSMKNRMPLSRMLQFLKDFNLFNEEITKEQVTIIYSKRCPSKTIDFAAFIDILYKINKSYSMGVEDKNLKFQLFLDQYLMSKYEDIIYNKPGYQIQNIVVFGREDSAENECLRILEGHDNLLKHLYSLHESYNLQFGSKTVMTIKDFKKLCSEYCLVPVLCSFNEATSVFKRFEINSKGAIDFKGFVLTICCIAHVGFDKGQYTSKFDTFSKKLLKLLGFIQEINSSVSDELLLKQMRTLKQM
jgi:hypothetical protein